ncbi:MAG TPA: KOW motif-containing protein, partial [Nitrososphaeraceae archaeon]|nr:KOW motif-containing protein [Nitrososphaeraceae archaeon]
IRGELPFKDIEGYLVKKPVVSELNIDDTVEVIAGPFKAMKAKITRVDMKSKKPQWFFLILHIKFLLQWMQII